MQVAHELDEQDKVSQLQLCNEFLDFSKNNSNIVYTLLMSGEAHCHVSDHGISRIVVTGLQTTYINFTNILCIVQSVVCSLFSWHYWCLFLWECKGAYINCECRAVHSHAGNISVHWVTSSSARFAVVPTRWSNCSHSRHFHASPQDNVSAQTHSSFLGHRLARLLASPCSTRLLHLGPC